MGFDGELGYSSDEYVEEAQSELVCIDAEERLGYSDRDIFPPDYDGIETVIELLLRRGESAVPWRSIPTLPSRRRTEIPRSSLLGLPVDILLLIYDQLSIYDAICLALTNTALYNISHRKLYGVICPRHIGSWAGKRLIWLDDTMEFRSFRRYYELVETLKRTQRAMVSSHSSLWSRTSGGISKKMVDTPFKVVSRFSNRLPWNSPWDYDPTTQNARDLSTLPIEEVKKLRLRSLGPDIRRMQSVWFEWQSGRQVLPLPFRRFVEGFVQQQLHLSLLQEESYVLRNLDRGLYVKLDGYDAREMVRAVIFGPDGSKRGKLSPGYNKWCGDRFDIVKTETMLKESGWKDSRAAGPAPEDHIVQILKDYGIL
ncbi:hypothetical protein H072_6647 [Dactylellina haptotyla CBS 200.50]|uniref:F-box domain-containing protein n=1 Tax=Dactylellina haptotyla (strain CBS 200.50) TaxID=1284197 RepID=S8A9E3_DACHA|nr:hypothetical protein H072_6647 [Dactylellina haptotyla CBS 200.50]